MAHTIYLFGKKNYIICASIHLFSELWRELYIYRLPPPQALPREKYKGQLDTYPKEWIDKRLHGIAVRQDLTDEWKERGATSSNEFALLTNEIMQGTFDLEVDEYKQVKSLARENLRDHMMDIELILTMLADATTTKLRRNRVRGA